MTNQPEVLIVGGGLAGLACARAVTAAGLPASLLEASDGLGGRVRTDVVDGFRLDRGFQVLLTAYPEARDQFDYHALRLREFRPGTLVRWSGRFHRLGDPRREPGTLLATLAAPVGGLADKLKIAQLQSAVLAESTDLLMLRPEQSSLAALRQRGFSNAMIRRFFRPWLGGIFLDPSLSTSSRMFEFVFRMFALGGAALPSDGMGALPGQLAASLPPHAIRLHCPVTAVSAGSVTLADGQTLTARAVVLATDGATAARLTPQVTIAGSQAVDCLYFASPTSPVDEPILVLNGADDGLVNNLCVPSDVAPSYAPAGQALVSATVLDRGARSDEELLDSVLAELREWYGEQVDGWRHLRSYRIDHALPAQPAGVLDPPERPVRLDDGLFVCGDHRDNASLNGALVSGRRAAEAVIAALQGT